MNTSTGQGGLEQRSFRNSGIRLSGNVVMGLRIPRVINGSSECKRRSAKVIDLPSTGQTHQLESRSIRHRVKDLCPSTAEVILWSIYGPIKVTEGYFGRFW